MKAVHVVVGIVAASVLLAGCGTQSTTPTTPAVQNESGQVGAPKAAEDKKGDTTLTGSISMVGEKYFITVPGQQPKEIESYLVKLDEYVGKSVTIVGQYSGDTLFVGKVQ